jgi:hypothetical protein
VQDIDGHGEQFIRGDILSLKAGHGSAEPVRSEKAGQV